MSPAGLAITLLVALAAIAVVLNHCYARLALVELALNEGLPPGHEVAAPGAQLTPVLHASTALPPGVHIFLSRSCHACQRLVDELDQSDFALQAALHVRYVDRPRPIARQAAERHQAELHENQGELAAGLGADPLPFTVAVGSHALVSRSVSPTIEHVLATARDAGITAMRSEANAGQPT